MRNAAKLVELTMQAGINAVEPGTRQCDAVAVIYSAQIHGTDAFGGEYTSLVPMLLSGVGTTIPHLTWSSEPFNHGKPLSWSLRNAECVITVQCPEPCILAPHHPVWPRSQTSLLMR